MVKQEILNIIILKDILSVNTTKHYMINTCSAFLSNLSRHYY